MSDFTAASKHVAAVFVRGVENGKDVYYRQPYNIVTYNKEDANAKSYIEPIPQAIGDLGDPRPEKYNELFVTDTPPYDEVFRVNDGD